MMNLCEVFHITPRCIGILLYEILLTLGATVRSLLAVGMLINCCEVNQLV